MASLVLKIRALQGWRRLVMALFAGALAAAALPPLSLWPAVFVSLPVVIWMLDGVHAQSTSRRVRLFSAFVVGWAFAVGYFGVSLYWVGEAFLVDAELFAWLMPLAMTAMPAGLALFWGAAASLAMLFWSPGIGRILVFSASLAGLEWLRGHLFTGFPWNAPAYATDAILPVAQIASIVGMYGVSFLVLIWASAPAVLADAASARPARLVRHVGVLAIMLSALATFGYGIWRLGHTEIAVQPGIQLRIVQPNIAQKDKWRPQNREWIYQRYLELSRRKSDNGPITHVVWPESALPALIDEQGQVRRQIASAAGPGARTIMGSLRRQATGAGNRGNSDLFNSVLVVEADGSISARYDKQKLVPFGEYLPLARLLEPLGLRKLVVLPSGFASGPGPVTISMPGTPPFAPLICYEAIFPRALISRQDRPDWLLNVTNDAWFGRSAGPYQHLAQARMRAIEEGLPLVRAANTGISAIIDPLGRINQALGLGQQGVIDTPLSAPLRQTIYATHGDTAFFWALIVIFMGRIRTVFADNH
ncbi:MAG: apolipoprotein N-acyltransferase [Aestuariivirgaceae bacterium]